MPNQLWSCNSRPSHYWVLFYTSRFENWRFLNTWLFNCTSFSHCREWRICPFGSQFFSCSQRGYNDWFNVPLKFTSWREPTWTSPIVIVVMLWTMQWLPFSVNANNIYHLDIRVHIHISTTWFITNNKSKYTLVIFQIYLGVWHWQLRLTRAWPVELKQTIGWILDWKFHRHDDEWGIIGGLSLHLGFPFPSTFQCCLQSLQPSYREFRNGLVCYNAWAWLHVSYLLAGPLRARQNVC